MKQIRSIKEEPFKEVVEREWKNAKNIFPILNSYFKPKFKWVNFKGRKTAICRNIGFKKYQLQFTEKYLKFLGKYPFKSFEMVVRHEITHMLAGGHGPRFKKIANQLGGSHYRTWNFMEMKPTVYGEPLLKEETK